MVWLAASSPVTTRLVRHGPLGVIAALLIAALPAWIARIVVLGQRLEESVELRSDADLHDWERAMLKHLDEASAIASSNLGSPSSRRELRSAISQARRTLSSEEPSRGLGDDMNQVAALLDRLVEESSAARRQDDVVDDLRGAIEAFGVRTSSPEQLRLPD